MSKQVIVIILAVVSVLAYFDLGTQVMTPVFNSEAIVEPNVVASKATCAVPSPEHALVCREMEQRILAATVRIDLLSIRVAEDESGYDIYEQAYGHATLKNGRYLITHNHHPIPLSIAPKPEEIGVYTKATIYKANGQKIYETSLTNFTLVMTDTETMVFDVGENGRVHLEAAGVISAEFKDWTTLPLQTGMEVAEIDWDGHSAHVDWVPIVKIMSDRETPHLLLNNELMMGASGGGVFWNGYHIANNWARVEAYDHADQYLLSHSMVALNSTQVVSLSSS